MCYVNRQVNDSKFYNSSITNKINDCVLSSAFIGILKFTSFLKDCNYVSHVCQ